MSFLIFFLPSNKDYFTSYNMKKRSKYFLKHRKNRFYFIILNSNFFYCKPFDIFTNKIIFIYNSIFAFLLYSIID